jgi:ESS family glutamate:Na+ symporter
MSFSAENVDLWNLVLQLGIISAILLASNILRRKLPVIQKMLLPTAVLGGFLLLGVRLSGIIPIDTGLLEMLTYHGLAIGFIALSIRTMRKEKLKDGVGRVGMKSGALIASTYVLQGLAGLIISVALAYTVMPDLFKAAGILLPMGYGQGPGQANNIGTVYEGLGFLGGRSFALSLAAAGFLSACVVGVIYLNYLARKGEIKRVRQNDDEEVMNAGGVSVFQDPNEIPISQAVDKLTIQMALVLTVYLITYGVIVGLTSLASSMGEGLSHTVSSLLWGFNFLIGALIAMVFRSALVLLRRNKLMTHQYQNNYLLSRVSGFFFDLMIVAGIASIDIDVMKTLWLPFVLMSVVGAVLTFVYLRYVCKWLYPDYYYEGLLSMYGMLTGTISSGVLLLREVDPLFQTRASTNLLVGSGFAILLGAPMLLLIAIAPNSPEMTFLTMGLLAAYFVLMLLLMKGRKKKTGTNKTV